MKRLTPKKAGICFGALGALIFAWLQVAAVSRSTSSTAPISLIMVPFVSALGFSAFFAVGYCVCFIWVQLQDRKKAFGRRFMAAALTAVFIIGYLTIETVNGFETMNAVSEVEKSESAETLVKIFNESPLRTNKFVLGAIAQKETASPELLDRIAHLTDPELFDAMGSFFPVLGKNGKGLAVMRLVISNPNVLPETVEYLAAHTLNKYVLGDVASSPKTSVATLRRLEQERNYLVDWGLAFNRDTPPDVFAKLLDRAKSSTQQVTLETLERNPSAPADIHQRATELLKAFH